MRRKRKVAAPVLRREVLRAGMAVRRSLRRLESLSPLDSEFEKPIVLSILADAVALLAAIADDVTDVSHAAHGLVQRVQAQRVSA